MKGLSIKKLYYSISEVSEITTLKPYVLRYWETEFAELSPEKNRAGNRIYKHKDLQLILLIKKLLHDDKYTIEGAKKKITEELKANNNQLNFSFDVNPKDEIISLLKKELNDIKKLLEK